MYSINTVYIKTLKVLGYCRCTTNYRKILWCCAVQSELKSLAWKVKITIIA